MSLELNQRPNAPVTADSEENGEPFDIFTWHENRVQAALQKLHNVEPGARQVILETMSELQNSNLFWKLYSPFGDAMEAAGNDGKRRFQVELAMFARIFLAGTERGGNPLDGLNGGAEIGGD